MIEFNISLEDFLKMKSETRKLFISKYYHKIVRIFSAEHQLYWRKDAQGYTDKPDEA